MVPFFILGEAFALYHLLKNKNFSAIHAHWIIPQGLVAILVTNFIGKKIPILCTSHGGDLYGLRNFFLKKLKIFVLKKSNMVTVVSYAMQEEVIKLGVDPKKAHVIPMGVDLINQFVPHPQNSRIENSILFVGRLVEKKGVLYLLEAFSRIHHKYSNAILNIVGSGPEEFNLKKLAKKLNIEKKVNFWGSVENKLLYKLYQENEIVVFPSIIATDGDQEGFGLVLVEALGCECAIISTNLTAMKDIIVDNKNALIVEQKSVTQLEGKLCELLSNHDLRSKLGKNGRKFVLHNYDWKIIANRYAKLLRKIMWEKRKGLD